MSSEAVLDYDVTLTRTCCAYYRQLRLLHEHFQTDPGKLAEEQLRDYFLHVRLEKQWFPKTIRLCRSSAQKFYTEMLGKAEWTVFGALSVSQ